MCSNFQTRFFVIAEKCQKRPKMAKLFWVKRAWFEQAKE